MRMEEALETDCEVDIESGNDQQHSPSIVNKSLSSSEYAFEINFNKQK